MRAAAYTTAPVQTTASASTTSGSSFVARADECLPKRGCLPSTTPSSISQPSPTTVPEWITTPPPSFSSAPSSTSCPSIRFGASSEGCTQCFKAGRLACKLQALAHAASLERALESLEHAHDPQAAVGTRLRRLSGAHRLDEVAAFDLERLLVRGLGAHHVTGARGVLGVG